MIISITDSKTENFKYVKTGAMIRLGITFQSYIQEIGISSLFQQVALFTNAKSFKLSYQHQKFLHILHQ